MLRSVQELRGTWRGIGSAYQRFLSDGRLLVAARRDELDTDPVAIGNYWFEDGLFYVEEVQGSACGSEEGAYEVWLLDNDHIRFDPCVNRRRSIAGNRSGLLPVIVEWQCSG